MIFVLEQYQHRVGLSFVAKKKNDFQVQLTGYSDGTIFALCRPVMSLKGLFTVKLEWSGILTNFYQPLEPNWIEIKQVYPILQWSYHCTHECLETTNHLS